MTSTPIPSTPPDTTLAPTHDHMLRVQSAISTEVITARGYRTITDCDELQAIGFSAQQARVPGLLLPLWSTHGEACGAVFRPDNPRVIENKRKSPLPDGTWPCRVLKYEFPKGEPMRIDCPPACQPALADPTVTLWITEGQKKADALATRGLCAIALLGVWNFKGRNTYGGSTVLADFDYIAWRGSDRKGSEDRKKSEDRRARDVRIVFDSDVMTKSGVRQALTRLTRVLEGLGARVTPVYLPATASGDKQGVDDFLAAGGTLEQLDAMADGPRPEPKPARAVVTWLDDDPLTMNRPLALIQGHGYAAAWMPFRAEESEGLGRDGTVIRYAEPRITTGHEVVLVRDDGVVFGPHADKPMSEAGISVNLPLALREGHRWSPRAVKSYHAGERPDPAVTFNKVAACVDRFIDFDRSLAPQATMAEMLACYITATYLLDAFSVVGFLWPNGDRGCGKTQMLITTCHLAYLGEVVQMGGTFSSLRDMADYGACIAFDDAEGLDQARVDQDKRALLLAGNRRGIVLPVKEPASDRTWRIRYVNTFSPRLFSAISLPDPVLASRTIVVPLVRTSDATRANADLYATRLWPHPPAELRDDLWALGLAHLRELPDYEERVNQNSELIGRALEPWKALLATAQWLDDRGVNGLAERMTAVAMEYQRVRSQFETADIHILLIRALIACVCAGRGECAIMGEDTERGELDAGEADECYDHNILHMRMADIREQMDALLKSTDVRFKRDHISDQAIGEVLRALRFERSHFRTGNRWVIPVARVVDAAKAYGVGVPGQLAERSV